MKLACKVAGQPGLIVGYVAPKGGKVRAVVILGGELVDLPLSKIELANLPEELKAAPQTLNFSKAQTKAKFGVKAVG